MAGPCRFQINAEDGNGSQGRDRQPDKEEEGEIFRDVGGESVGNGFLIVEDQSASTPMQRRQKLSSKDHVSGLLGHIRARYP